MRLAAAASDIPPVAAGNNWDAFIDGRVIAPGGGRASLLYGVSAVDPLTFSGITLLIDR